MNKLAIASMAFAAGCSQGVKAPDGLYGTLEPFAAQAVYFVVTDRFVDGDPSNNHRQQGQPDRHTFDRPITDLQGRQGNIGYLGGDFRGIADNAPYISDLGFGAVWLTPIVENPDEAFMGGQALGEGFFADQGKTGYHGYWGVNFFVEDEHLVSEQLDFAALAAILDSNGLSTVLDIVCNHGSPSFTMPEDQPMFAELYDENGVLVADHQNLPPEQLDPSNPLHRFFKREPDIAQLSNFDEDNPEVLDYFVRAYLGWIDAGADAFRIDTIRHMPHQFWKAFSERIRDKHPGFFMFGESFEYDDARVAEHTWIENGRISVLDFPGQEAINAVFADGDPYSRLLDYLHLDDQLYQNPYELMIFYDNHDMPRMDAAATGFIDANNWLFTSRGIPVVYYGSEVMFRAGRPEHGGNRDYFGQDAIEAATENPVYKQLRRIARVRAATPALQRGLQLNLHFDADTASFLRVYHYGDTEQVVLVGLNKGDKDADIRLDQWRLPVAWVDALTGQVVESKRSPWRLQVPAHGVRVLVRDGPVTDPQLLSGLARLQRLRERD